MYLRGEKTNKRKTDFHRWMRQSMEKTINSEEPCGQMLRLI